jgi:2-polyprenyl-6-methoxyphenol hydroxylase-like FAD-dependent oxidoreductase
MQMGDKGTGNLMTSWDATYYRLKANFDGLVNPLCNDPPTIETGEGVAVFETGKKAIKVDEAENRMKVTVQDVVTGESQTYISDIVIAADGFNSTIRHQLHPTIHRDEPGYLLWRGTVPLKALSPAIRARIENKTMVYPMHRAYALFYTIPAENGSLMPEDRQINFVWYDYPTPTHASTADILTDTDGHTHRTTLPIGKMRPEAWARQVARAKDVMHPDLFTIVDKITQPFVTAISSVEYPHAKYFNDKLFFIGDALVQLQPNTGHGTAHAALEAMMLADVVEGKVTAAEWEEKVVEEAKVQRARSRNFPKQWLEDSGTGERVLL